MTLKKLAELPRLPIATVLSKEKSDSVLKRSNTYRKGTGSATAAFRRSRGIL